MLEIQTVTGPGIDLEAVKDLFREYQRFLGIPLDFQDFETELAELPGKYAPPAGALYLARWSGQPVGCVAFYPFPDPVCSSDQATSTCELKRLYVKPNCQGHGAGRQLFERAMIDAKALGYQRMILDSLRRLDKAGNLYLKLGFTEIPAYNHNPSRCVLHGKMALVKKPVFLAAFNFRGG